MTDAITQKADRVTEIKTIAEGIVTLATRIEAGEKLFAHNLEELKKIDNLDDLIRLMAQVRRAKDATDSAKKTLEALYGVMSNKIIPEMMRDKKIKTTTLADVGRVTVSNRTSCSMLDKEAGMEWLRANGLGDIIQETVNASTLAATAKTKIEEGFDLPDDVFKVSINPYVSITKI